MANPDVIHHITLHDQKLGVLSAINTSRTRGPIFFYVTVNSKWYVYSSLKN